MRSGKRRLLLYIPVLLWMGVIFMFSADNGSVSSMHSGRVSYMVASAVDTVLRLNMSDIEKSGFSKGLSFIVRKTAHFSEYFILGLLLYVVISVNYGRSLDYMDEDRSFLRIIRLRYFLPVIIVFGYAGTDELHQYFVPDRCSSFRDVLIDTAGGLAAILIISLIRYIRRRAAYNKANTSARRMDNENMQSEGKAGH